MSNAKPKIIVFAASVRTGSFNRQLAAVAADMVEAAGAMVERLDLVDYPMPIYDGNVEAESGLPTTVVRLKELFAAQDGMLIASPEYNASLSPLMKNTIDWLSRQGEDAEPMRPFRGKVAGLLSASPGRLGGLRGLYELRRVLSGIGVHVIPAQHALHTAGSAFSDNGTLVNQPDAEALRGVVEQLVSTTGGVKMMSVMVAGPAKKVGKAAPKAKGKVIKKVAKPKTAEGKVGVRKGRLAPAVDDDRLANRSAPKAVVGANKGKVIRHVASTNPRKAGTWGWHSWELVATNGGEMMYDDYILAGGRTNDLRWDVARGWTEIVDVPKGKK